MLRVLAVVSLLPVAGCFPAVVHPTRVGSEFRLAPVLSTSLVEDSSGGSPNVWRGPTVSLDVEASLGIRDTSSGSQGMGLRLGGSGGLAGYGGSVYVELPRGWLGEVDAGLGILFHRGLVRVQMPYLQFGALRGSESSWFMRNGVAWITTRDSTDRRPAWVPTLGWMRHRSGTGGTIDGALYLTGIVGNQPQARRGCILFECVGGESAFVRTLLILGMSVSLPFQALAVWR